MARDTILVIDDDPDFREMVRMLVELQGLTLLEAPDCAQGLFIVHEQRERLRLVLLDYFMPGMDPARCASSVVAAAAPYVPVVLVTAAVNAAERAAELHLSRWLSKPFSPSTLESLLVEPMNSAGAGGA